MPIVTLLEKVYGPFPPNLFEPFFSSICEGLEIKLRIAGKTDRGWVKADVSGEDKAVAVRLLDQKIGLAPVSVNDLKKFSLLKGRVISSEARNDHLSVDVGIFSPYFVDAIIPLQTLQAQIADGARLSLEKLVDLFCLYVNMPLEVKKLGDAGSENDYIGAMLSEAQFARFADWVNSHLDRLIIFGAPFSQIEAVIRRSRHVRDVVRIESLGLLEHVVLCKLGTEAKGLLSKFGPKLPHAVLAPFSPKKIKRVVKRPFL